MKVTIEIDVEPQDVQRVLEFSLQRVINNAISVGLEIQDLRESPSDEVRLNASILWQDCRDLRDILSYVWAAFQEGVRRRAAN